MESNSFIDKVFDAYLKSDYKYGDDNLNPKREINKNTKVDTQEELDRILEQVHAKIQEIGKKYDKKSFQEPKVSANMNGDGKNEKGINESLKNAIARAGGNGNNLVLIPSMEDSTDPISLEIGILIPKIIGTLPKTPDKDENVEGKPDDSQIDGPELFKINCDGTIDIISGKEKEKDSDSNSEDSGENNNNLRAGVNNDLEEDTSSGGGGSSGGGDSSGTTDSGSDDMSANLADATNKALSKMNANIGKDNMAATECALADLKILQTVLAILKIVKTLQKVISLALNLAVELVQIVVLAAQCWNNPTCIGEILQRVGQKIMAIMIMIVAKLLQMIWNLLGLDCITAQAQSTIAEIKATMAGISSVFSEVDKTALSLGNGIDKVKDAFDEASEEVEKALNYSLEDRLKDQFDMSELAKNLYNSDYAKDPISALKSDAMEAVGQTDAYDTVMDTVEDIKSLKDSAKKMIDAFMKMKSKDSEVSKFASRFNNITAK